MTLDPEDLARVRAALAPPPDPRDPDSGIIERCRRLSWHAPHQWSRPIGEGTTHHYLCPGVAHDHAARCCTVHNVHTTPHKGCVLR